jgi:hypothetical protein
VGWIAQAVQPSAQQANLLNALQSALSEASADVQASCPAAIPPDLLQRLSAIDARIAAMVKAIEAVRPPLASFYASLDDEQKAKFNAMAAPHESGAGVDGAIAASPRR